MKKGFCIFFAAALFLSVSGRIIAQTVTTDAPDYPPGSTAQISGSGFQPGETVQLQVANLTDPSDIGPEHDPWQVAADADGNFQTTWFVTYDEAGMTLQLTAAGLSSGLTAQATFTDGTASDGDGTMTVSPTSTTVGSSGNTFTFTFKSPNGRQFNSGSQISIDVPSGWTTPQTNSSSSAGFVRASPDINATVGVISITNRTIVLNMTASANGQIFVSFTNVTAGNAGTATFTAKSRSGSAGTLTALASSPAVTVNKASTTTVLAASANPSTFGLSVILTATISATAPGGGTPTGTVTFKEGTAALATNALNGSAVATYTNSTFFAGSHSITASYNGDANYITNTSSVLTQTVNKADQTIASGTLNTKNYGDPPFAVSATASSGLPANFSIASGPATISGNTVTITGVGTVKVDANQAGNSNYNAAATVERPFTVNAATLAVTGITANNKVYDGGTNATLNLGGVTLLGVTNGDNITLNTASATGAFADQNAGTGKTVTVSGLTISGARATNYSLTQPTMTANISSATLTVTANSTNRIYGAANPTFTASYSSFASGDNTSVLSGSPSFSTTANTTSTVAGSPYSIIATNGTLSAANYNFNFVNGQLTITPASTTNFVSTSASPSPTGSNVTLTARLTAVAPGSGTPASNVQFIVDGSASGSPVALSGGIASISTASLSHGYHTVTAQYAGDGNFFGSTNNLSSNQLINTSPVGGTSSITTTKNTAASVFVAKLIAIASDADYDPISVTAAGATSVNGGTVSLGGSKVTYTPPNNFVGADSFTYTVSDTFGGTGTGTVNVTVNADQGTSTQNISIAPPQPDGSATIILSGIPGRSYLLQASINMIDWAVIRTNVADTNGLILFIDSDATNYPSRFYRSSTP